MLNSRRIWKKKHTGRKRPTMAIRLRFLTDNRFVKLSSQVVYRDYQTQLILLMIHCLLQFTLLIAVACNWQRSSSMREPRDPPFWVVFQFCHFDQDLTDQIIEWFLEKLYFLTIDGKKLEVVKSAKLLGLTNKWQPDLERPCERDRQES